VKRALIVLMFIAGCGDRGAVRAEVDEGANHDFPGTPLEVGVADDVGAWIDHTLVGRMPREVGASMPVPFEGRSCELAVVRTFTRQETDPQNERRKISRERKYDYYNGAELELRCADGPAPGAAGTLRGGSPRQALPWVVPALLLAFRALASPDCSEVRLSTLLLRLSPGVTQSAGLNAWYCPLPSRMSSK
jgi:hypothetical protein